MRSSAICSDAPCSNDPPSKLSATVTRCPWRASSGSATKETAKLARDIIREEERMQKFLAKLLPELSVDLAHDEIPVSEIEGGAARRKATDSKPKRSSGRTTTASGGKKTAAGGSKTKKT